MLKESSTQAVHRSPSSESSNPIERWTPLLQDALAKEGLLRWPLRGGSMIPTLPAECEIEICPMPDPVRTGSLIVFATGDTLVAHRLVRRAGDRWIAQGDNRLSPDPVVVPAQLVGVVRAAYVGLRRVWPSRRERLVAMVWVGRYHALRPLRWCRRALRLVLGGYPRGNAR